jgi:2-polyprenyl-3-methyl-5-hydroxy-6-metoxy-1,4-benzoquinol methylase
MDVIILWDVLEHMPSPRFTLNRIHNLLQPDDLVFSPSRISTELSANCSWLNRLDGMLRVTMPYLILQLSSDDWLKLVLKW